MRRWGGEESRGREVKVKSEELVGSIVLFINCRGFSQIPCSFPANVEEIALTGISQLTRVEIKECWTTEWRVEGAEGAGSLQIKSWPRES